MKKRALILILAIIVMAQAALASVTLNSNLKDKYNLGERIAVSGSVSSVEGMSGFLKTSVECGDNAIRLDLTPLTLAAGTQKSFPGQTLVSPIIVSSTMDGICNIRVSTIEGGVETDSALSADFEVTKELKASFRLSETKVQVGKDIKLTGMVTRLDGTPINGAAEIYSVYAGTKYLLDVVNINNGVLDYTYKTAALPTGDYNIEVLARDSFVNEQLFAAASYTLTNTLNIIAQIDKSQYAPGDIVILSGELKNILGETVNDATLYFSLDGMQSALEINKGKFEQKVDLSNTIKSGVHTLTVSVNDNVGNSGHTVVSFTINPVPSKMELDVPYTESQPLGSIDVRPKLLDQAGDLIKTKVELEIKNAKGDVAVSGQFDSGKKIGYTLGQYAVPSEWKVTASYGKLNAKAVFNVAEVKDLQVGVSSALVTFLNTGNVKWKDNIAMTLEGAETFSTQFTKNINPGEEQQLDLSQEAPSGKYKVTVSLPDRTEVFDNVSIENGKNIYSLDIPYILMLLLVIGLIVYEVTLLTRKHGKSTPKLGHDDLRRLARTARSHVDEKTAADNEKAKLLNDYKRMTLDEIKRTEAKIKPSYPEQPWRRKVERRPASQPRKEEGGDTGGAASFFGAF